MLSGRAKRHKAAGCSNIGAGVLGKVGPGCRSRAAGRRHCRADLPACLIDGQDEPPGQAKLRSSLRDTASALPALSRRLGW